MRKMSSETLKMADRRHGRATVTQQDRGNAEGSVNLGPKREARRHGHVASIWSREEFRSQKSGAR